MTGRIAVRLFACVSGIFLGIAIMLTLEAADELLFGNVSSWLRYAPLLNGALVIVVWLALRGRVLRSRATKSIAACAAAAAVVFVLIGSGFHWASTHSMRGADMASDLRKLVTAQEQFRRDSGRYSATVPPGYSVSPGVLGPTITLTADGWTAMTSQPRLPQVCSVFVGRTPMPPAEAEGVPVCTSSSSGVTDPEFPSWLLMLVVLAAIFGALAIWLDRSEPATS